MFLGDSRKRSGKQVVSRENGVCETSLKQKAFLLFILFAGLLLSCDNDYVRGWYDLVAGEADSGESSEITLYYFADSASVGVIGGGSGSAGDPVLITITYPLGTSVPASDADIHIVHTGASIKVDGPWVPADGGFVRFYTLTAAGGTVKHYRVAATEAEHIVEVSEIRLYYFMNPTGIGVIGGGSGSAGDPVVINITYPYGTSVPASDADIHIIHTGAGVEADGSWAQTGGGFVRLYTLTAADGTAKHYRVVATEAASTGTSSSGVIGVFYFSATNGLMEGHTNTQEGAVAGVFSDPDTGDYPFKYDLIDNTDFFEIGEDGDTALLKIISPLEAKSPWIVRVRVTDKTGSFYEGPVQFVVNPAGTVRPITGDFNFARAPGGLWIHSLGGEIAGTFSPPEDGSGTAPFWYELVTGDGANDADNGNFEIANGGSALSIKASAVLDAAANPYNIYVKMTDSLGETRFRAFEFDIGVGRILITDHPPGTHPYTARLYAGSLDAKTFTNPSAAPISEGEAVARSTIADMVVHGTVSPQEGDGAEYALLLSDTESGDYVGYFNGVKFEDGIATVGWPEVWHTFTDAVSFSAFMAAPDSTSNKDYRIALSGIDMETELSTGKSHDLYFLLKSDYRYSFDFRGCTGESFASAAGHPNAAQITEVYLTETLKTVGNYAFDGCLNMTKTQLPSAVETVGNYAFRGCHDLPDVVFPETIKRIGDYAFADCTKITAVDLSGSALESVGQYAFYSVTVVGSTYTYPSKIVSVDFSGCESLLSVGISAFRECRLLESVSFDSCSAMTAVGGYAFYDCYSMASIDFSDCGELETIGQYAFYNCDMVVTVDFSDCVKLKTIGAYAFSWCNVLATVDLSNTKLETIGDAAFYYSSNLTTIDLLAVKSTLKTIGSGAFQYCSNLATVNLSSCEKLETIGNGAFYSCSLFTEAVDLTKSKTTLTSIESYAFYGSGIVSANLNGCTALVSIGSYAFQNSGIVSANLTGCTALATIQDSTFRYCSNLTTVTLTNCIKLTTIANGSVSGTTYYGAFANSPSLTTVTLTGTKIATIGSYAFYGCTGLETLLNSTNLAPIKTTLTTIGSYAFQNSGVTTAEFGECAALETIGIYAFDNCKSLTILQLPSSLISVGDYAFEHCLKLATITSKISNPGSVLSGTFTFTGIVDKFTLWVPSAQKSDYETFWASKTSWAQPGSVQVLGL
jgi:hypothetical protein